MLYHSFIRGKFVDGLTKTQKNHALEGVGNFRLGIAEFMEEGLEIAPAPR
jgi:hypothetical protein